MIRYFKYAALCGVLLATTAFRPAVAASDFWLEIAPPPPRLEITPAPRHNRVWSPGYYAWFDHHHSWISGHWKEARAGWTWIPDHWVPDSSSWLFRAGHWEPDVAVRG